jgi:ADP-ribose pyrophosphatase
MTSMGGFFTAPGYSDEYLHLFLAEGLFLAPLPPDEYEMTDLIVLTQEEAKQKILNNEIHDAKTIAGILRYLCVN